MIDQAIWAGVVGAAVSAIATGGITLWVTRRSIKASEREGAKQRSHDSDQRKEDRNTQLQVVRLEAHEAAVRQAYVLVQTEARQSLIQAFGMRMEVFSGQLVTLPEWPAQSEGTYALVDLSFSEDVQSSYQSFRKAEDDLKASLQKYRDARARHQPGATTVAQEQAAFESAYRGHSAACEALKIAMREDLDPMKTPRAPLPRVRYPAPVDS